MASSIEVMDISESAASGDGGFTEVVNPKKRLRGDGGGEGGGGASGGERGGGVGVAKSVETDLFSRCASIRARDFVTRIIATTS